jgi:hypothetical protein
MTTNNNKARQIFYDHIIANHKTIKIKPGKCRYNYKCQMNAVHEAKKNKHKKIAMCVYMDGGNPNIHFINYHKGKYTDNTLGQWSKCYNYYFIKWIDEADMWNVDAIFTAFRKDLKNMLPWWIRMTSDYEC